ncbi:MAG TPA: thiamine pyrophosphate-binding protein [Candidatus Nanoarchaeia archaeon]|nr:thiamine pyrophosphate-binding protein [Candidatus Nanoarchaeia archaeon]
MIKSLAFKGVDKDRLGRINIDSSKIRDDFFDYSKAIVKKPWGYEYLIYQNDRVAVWILYIKKGHTTSMHCHPSKKTSLIVLYGNAVCSTLSEKTKMSPGDGLLIPKAVFHSTKSDSDGGIFIMEVENSTNKRDLVRIEDNYGRAGLGYETIESISFDLKNYNYISMINSSIYYNVKKKFEKCSISLQKFSGCDDFVSSLEKNPEDVIILLKGKVMDKSRKGIIDFGDTLDAKKIISLRPHFIEGQVEAILVKKNDSMVKVSDFIASFLEKNSLKNIFLVPGNTNMHLIDSIGKNTEMKYISTQTEQAAIMAAESFAKLTGNVGVAIVSSGAACANSLIGIADSWVDSTPVLAISGQCQSDQIANDGLRQLGVQEIDIISIVKPITKYCVRINDPHKIKYHLEKALYIANNKRKGPVWLDIPIDVLGSNIDEKKMDSFNESESKNLRIMQSQIKEVISLLNSSKRPVIFAGSGTRISGAKDDFVELIKALKIPVLTTRKGSDLLTEKNPFNYGRAGAYGQRSANFIIQNADLVISIGARLSILHLGRNFGAFAMHAKKIVVDIDSNELRKKTIKPAIAINADAKEFICELVKSTKKVNTQFSGWIKKCDYYKSKYSESPIDKKKGFVNPYFFIKSLSSELKENSVIAVDGGSPLIYFIQMFKFKSGQRVIASTGLDNPSFSLPAAIGAVASSPNSGIVCICEDHGFLRQAQELETISYAKMPIKIFVLNSGGHSYLRKIQKEYFGQRYTASFRTNKLSSGYISGICKAYGIEYCSVSESKNLEKSLADFLKIKGPAVCELNIDPEQEIIPRIILEVKQDGNWIAKPLEDMYPFLNRKEFKENMINKSSDEN